MENDNEQVLDTGVQEDQEVIEQGADDTVTVSKAEFKKLTRRSIAYETLKKTAEPINQPKQEHKIADEIVQDVKILKEEREKRQFGFEHKLSPEETDYAFKFAGGKPNKEVLEDPFFKGGIESLRSKQRLEANIPGSSSRSSVFTEKSFAETPEEDRKKIFESKMKGIKK